MEVMGKNDKMLKAMKVDYTGEIVLVEEDIPVVDLNWNQAPRRRRPRRREFQRLLAKFPYDPLFASPSGVTRGGTEFHMY
ncbi:hypothetical protein AMTR_s00017p00218110 [Amborella trichopoda]|uniref:Uncharacterized protein n=1 Tax=Amborella trichopoda TaxID=13333 RepID=W1PLZ1_AMBTC|nr:hypothetical protein AMTR_s00017p00218110 [Amborella trichopoda]